MKLRRIVPAMVLGLTGTAVVSLVALIGITDVLESSGAEVVYAVHGLRLAGDIEQDLLRHRREVLAWVLSDDPAHQLLAIQAMSSVERLLSLAAETEDAPGELEALRAVQARLYAYRAAVQAGDIRPDEPLDAVIRSYHATADAFDAVLAATDALGEVYEQHATEVQAMAVRTNKRANLAAGALIAALFAAAGGSAYTMLRLLYLPLQPLRETISRLAGGELTARAPVGGPDEYADIARGLNQLAEELHGRRQDQLAFMGAVAHDLRNPLSALGLMAGRGKPGRPLPDEDEVRSFYARVSEQVRLMSRLVSDLLDVARLEAGAISIRIAEFDLAALAERVIALERAASTAHDIALHVEGNPVVEADAVRMEQVLTNLVGNAIKYSPGGGRVDVRIVTTNGDVQLEVADDGIGIAEDELPQLFRPFRRSRNVGDIPGTGLGLSTTARIVEAHGGSIEVRSSLGRGSVFSVRLPRTGPASGPPAGWSYSRASPR